METKNILIAGCGALGSQIALHLCHHSSLHLVLLDDDRVDTNNIQNGTSIYASHQEGQLKVNALSEMIWGRGNSAHDVIAKRLVSRRVHDMLKGIDLVIDCFDNAESRNLLHRYPVNEVLHVGVTSDRIGAITWDKDWQYLDPDDTEENIVCTHELGAPILRLTSAVAANVIELYLRNGTRKNVTLTADLRIWK